MTVWQEAVRGGHQCGPGFKPADTHQQFLLLTLLLRLWLPVAAVSLCRSSWRFLLHPQQQQMDVWSADTHLFRLGCFYPGLIGKASSVSSALKLDIDPSTSPPPPFWRWRSTHSLLVIPSLSFRPALLPSVTPGIHLIGILLIYASWLPSLVSSHINGRRGVRLSKLEEHCSSNLLNN